MYGLDWEATSLMQGSASGVADGVLSAAAVSWLIRFELDDGRRLCTGKIPCGRWKLLVVEEPVDMAWLSKNWTSQAKNHRFASSIWVLSPLCVEPSSGMRVFRLSRSDVPMVIARAGAPPCDAAAPAPKITFVPASAAWIGRLLPRAPGSPVLALSISWRGGGGLDRVGATPS
ncbi:hypothetical protein NL676_023849 [Syzygium grande]|nr:hypothetical protein NL676_023849 [Syzygium grande]